jgi:A/G-specific adenine glycosylase
MLQQTQVQTVIAYWKRWLARLPTVESLARARIHTVLKLWEGLGYYRRARNAHDAARRIVAQHGGRMPQDAPTLEALPGIGRYTAGAISSIAFNQPDPILDGNVIRVLTRWHGIRADPRNRIVRESLWEIARTLVREAGRLEQDGQRNCSALNQGLMELGALVCSPRTPRCPACPLQRRCVARKTDQIESIPATSGRFAMIERTMAVLVLWHEARLLVRQRGLYGVNAGLWEFPSVETHRNDQVRTINLPVRHGALESAPAFLMELVHSITFHRIRLRVYEARTRSPNPVDSGTRWCSLKQLGQLAMPAAHRKVVDRLRQGGRPHPERVSNNLSINSTARR